MGELDVANGRAVRMSRASDPEWSCTGQLQNLPLFRGMGPSSIREILCNASIQRIRRNTVLFIQDDPATHVFVILEGWVKLFRETAEGHESTISILSSGQSFIEAAFLDHAVLVERLLELDPGTRTNGLLT